MERDRVIQRILLQGEYEAGEGKSPTPPKEDGFDLPTIEDAEEVVRAGQLELDRLNRIRGRRNHIIFSEEFGVI